VTQPAADVSPNGVPPQATMDLIIEGLKGMKRIDRWKFKVGEFEDLEDEAGRPVSSQIASPAPSSATEGSKPTPSSISSGG